ncbi:MAG: EamA family transporter [Planctomycetota bacterium]
MYVLGILLGLISAAGSSSAYLFSRLHALRHARDAPDQASWRGPLGLLVCAHLYLGVVCSLAALVLWPRGERMPADLGWALLTCLGVAVFYLLANALLFFALQRVDASRVAPLLGFKVVVLAMVMRFGLGEPLSGQQWVAVVLASSAAVMLGATGGRVSTRAAALVGGACLGFVLSDVCISRMVPAMLPAGIVADRASGGQRMLASLTGMTLCYVFCGAVAVALLPMVGFRDKRPWRAAAPYALSWLTAMVCLFSAFAIIGVVLGNILQSTRGLLSIGVGVVIARLGHHELESHATWGVIVRRIIAAAVMTAAIGLYVAAEVGR